MDSQQKMKENFKSTSFVCSILSIMLAISEILFLSNSVKLPLFCLEILYTQTLLRKFAMVLLLPLVSVGHLLDPDSGTAVLAGFAQAYPTDKHSDRRYIMRLFSYILHKLRLRVSYGIYSWTLQGRINHSKVRVRWEILLLWRVKEREVSSLWLLQWLELRLYLLLRLHASRLSLHIRSLLQWLWLFHIRLVSEVLVWRLLHHRHTL